MGSTVSFSGGTPRAAAISATAAETQTKRAVSRTSAGQRCASTVPRQFFCLLTSPPCRVTTSLQVQRPGQRQGQCAAAGELGVEDAAPPHSIVMARTSRAMTERRDQRRWHHPEMPEQ